MQYINVANQGVKSLSPYQAGKPIEELERELGITNIVKPVSYTHLTLPTICSV